MSVLKLLEPIKTELDLVEHRLNKEINTDIQLLQDAALQLMQAGGKRLRPAFFILSGKIFKTPTEKLLPMAVALEMVHMATLIHDDLIDDSDLRRGEKTVKCQYGNRMAIYSGNYLFARSLALVAEYKRADIINMLADASMIICEGEIDQLNSAFDINQGLKKYLRRIKRKTALLLSLSCELGGLIGDAPDYQVRALKQYGYYSGMAFQISDDVLDFTADEDVLGKPTGSDIRQGLITLPLLYALNYSDQRKYLRELINTEENCNKNVEEIIGIVLKSYGIEYAYNICDRYIKWAKKELSVLPNGMERRTLEDIADNIARRKY